VGVKSSISMPFVAELELVLTVGVVVGGSEVGDSDTGGSDGGGSEDDGSPAGGWDTSGGELLVGPVVGAAVAPELGRLGAIA
jgi:hypothetical protein